MKKALFVAIATLSTLLLMNSCCACRKSSNATHKPLKATVWTLVQMEGKNITAEMAEDGAPRIIFSPEDGTFGGYGGCNSMGGEYRMTPSEALSQRDVAGEISLGGIFSTKRMCQNGRLETKFFRLLASVDSFTIEQNRLFLFSGGEMTLLFEASEGAGQPAK